MALAVCVHPMRGKAPVASRDGLLELDGLGVVHEAAEWIPGIRPCRAVVEDWSLTFQPLREWSMTIFVIRRDDPRSHFKYV